jgi:hypothetical protein
MIVPAEAEAAANNNTANTIRAIESKLPMNWERVSTVFKSLPGHHFSIPTTTIPT